MSRSTTIGCDWCEAVQSERYLTYSEHWLVAHATWEGARYSWDFCSDECLDAWRAHGRHHREYVEHMRKAFADMSDEQLAACHRVGADVERRRRANELAKERGR